jgi:hypothetical protein
MTKLATKKPGLRITTSVKAGGLAAHNHNRAGLKVRSAVKAGGLAAHNHNRRALRAS